MSPGSREDDRSFEEVTGLRGGAAVVEVSVLLLPRLVVAAPLAKRSSSWISAMQSAGDSKS
jgi:hypothetical protein